MHGTNRSSSSRGRSSSAAAGGAINVLVQAPRPARRRRPPDRASGRDRQGLLAARRARASPDPRGAATRGGRRRRGRESCGARPRGAARHRRACRGRVVRDSWGPQRCGWSRHEPVLRRPAAPRPPGSGYGCGAMAPADGSSRGAEPGRGAATPLSLADSRRASEDRSSAIDCPGNPMARDPRTPSVSTGPEDFRAVAPVMVFCSIPAARRRGSPRSPRAPGRGSRIPRHRVPRHARRALDPPTTDPPTPGDRRRATRSSRHRRPGSAPRLVRSGRSHGPGRRYPLPWRSRRRRTTEHRFVPLCRPHRCRPQLVPDDATAASAPVRAAPGIGGADSAPPAADRHERLLLEDPLTLALVERREVLDGRGRTLGPEVGRVERDEALDENVDRASRSGVSLERPLDEDERFGPYRQTIAFVDLGRHDDVHGAGLVLDQEEHHPLGGARPLARDDEPADAHRRSMAHGLEVRARHRPPCLQARPATGAAGGDGRSGRWWRSRRSSRPTPPPAPAQAPRGDSAGAPSACRPPPLRTPVRRCRGATARCDGRRTTGRRRCQPSSTIGCA